MLLALDPQFGLRFWWAPLTEIQVDMVNRFLPLSLLGLFSIVRL